MVACYIGTNSTSMPATPGSAHQLRPTEAQRMADVPTHPHAHPATSISPMPCPPAHVGVHRLPRLVVHQRILHHARQVRLEVQPACILALVHLVADGGQIHRFLDDLLVPRRLGSGTGRWEHSGSHVWGQWHGRVGAAQANARTKARTEEEGLLACTSQGKTVCLLQLPPAAPDCYATLLPHTHPTHPAVTSHSPGRVARAWQR